jgi:hypothetical protein
MQGKEKMEPDTNVGLARRLHDDMDSCANSHYAMIGACEREEVDRHDDDDGDGDGVVAPGTSGPSKRVFDGVSPAFLACAFIALVALAFAVLVAVRRLSKAPVLV